MTNERGSYYLWLQSNPDPCQSVRAYQRAGSFQVGRCSCLRSLVQHCRLDLRPRGIYFQRTRPRNQESGWLTRRGEYFDNLSGFTGFLQALLTQKQAASKFPQNASHDHANSYPGPFIGIFRDQKLQIYPIRTSPIVFGTHEAVNEIKRDPAEN